jgi:hypothetical protein
MAKVRALFTNGTVQGILCEAADKGFREVVIIGRSQDGLYHLKKSELLSTVEVVGIIEMAKQWLLEQMGEE